MVRTLGKLLRPSADRQRLVRFAPVFILSGIGTAFGPAAYMALFNSRLGTDYLPGVFVFTAIALLVGTLLISTIGARISRVAFNQGFFILITAAILVMWGLVVAFPTVTGIFFLLVVVSDTVIEMYTLQLWTGALAACDTQQARRLFPLLTAVSVGGSILGGLVAGPLAYLVGAEGVYLLWGVSLLLMTIAQIPISRTYLKLSEDEAHARAARRAAPEPSSGGLRANLDYIRKSPFLMMMMVSVTLIMALVFLSYYTFYSVAEQVVVDEAASTTFFALFAGTFQTLALFISLGVTGSAMERWGVGRMGAVLALLYIVAFAILFGGVGTPLALAAVFVAHNLAKNAAYTISDPVTKVMSKVIPPEQGDSVRVLIEGVSNLSGMLIGAGLGALHSELGVNLNLLMGLGLGASVVFLFMSLRVNRIYLSTLLDALIAGRNDLLREVPEWLGRPTPAVLTTLRQSLRQRSPGAQELAMQTLERLDAPETLPEVLPLMNSPYPNVRNAAVRCAVALARARSAPLRVKPQVITALRGALWEVPPEMRARVFLGLEQLQAPERPDRLIGLRNMLDSERLPVRHAAVDAIAEGNLTELAKHLMPLLKEENHRLRGRAIRALGTLDYEEAVPPMLKMLPDADRITSEALIDALSRMHDVGPLLKALAVMPLQAQAHLLKALALSPQSGDFHDQLVNVAVKQLQIAHDFPAEPVALNDLTSLLHNRLVDIKLVVQDAALTLLGAFTDSGAIGIIRQSLATEQGQDRANALEALDSLGERRLTIALMAAYLNTTTHVPRDLSAVDDPWVRAISARLNGEGLVNSPDQTLNLDRILMLKQVPLFSQLSLNELQIVAAAAEEEIFDPNAELMREGEDGDRLFVVIKGRVEVRTVIKGETRVLATQISGSVVGEMALLDDAPRSATVVAVEPTLTLTLHRDTFRRLIYQYPEIADALLREMARRLRQR